MWLKLWQHAAANDTDCVLLSPGGVLFMVPLAGDWGNVCGCSVGVWQPLSQHAYDICNRDLKGCAAAGAAVATSYASQRSRTGASAQVQYRLQPYGRLAELSHAVLQHGTTTRLVKGGMCF